MRQNPRGLRSVSLLLAAAIALLSAGCASVPIGSEPQASCTLLSSMDAGTYGTNFFTNPFMKPSSLIRGTPDEFVVLDLTLRLPESATVNLEGSVTQDSGDTVARMYTLKEMHTYWDGWGDNSDVTSRTRIEALERYYAPSDQFQAHKGRSEYVVVLMGKNPLPRPATVEFSVSINGVPQPFKFPLPPLK